MRFWKYQGLGNDFILLIDGREAVQDPEIIRSLCDRRFGIGADGVLFLVGSGKADAGMRIFNADGSEAEMCGNGIRCLAKHLYESGSVQKETMVIETLAGLKGVELTVERGVVTGVEVDMGPPSLECKTIPMDCQGQFIDEEIEVEEFRIRGTAVLMGNPHFVIFQDLSEEETLELGPLIEKHPLFPNRTNVEFVEIMKNGLKVSVYERGAGWTLACGTGASATAVAATLNGEAPFDEEIEVELPGGSLWITVPEDLSTVKMKGPAVRVFHGDIQLGD